MSSEGARATRGETTRLAIIEAAIRLFSERGFEVTTREIARTVGIASPSLYKHFASIDEIIAEALRVVADHRAGKYRRVLALDRPPRERLKHIAITMLDGFLGDQTLVHLYQQVMIPRAGRALDLTTALWDAELHPRFLDTIRAVDPAVDPGFTYYLLFSFSLGAAAYMPTQDRRRPLTGAERSALVLAERGLAAALPRIDWSTVAPIAPRQ